MRRGIIPRVNSEVDEFTARFIFFARCQPGHHDERGGSSTWNTEDSRQGSTNHIAYEPLIRGRHALTAVMEFVFLARSYTSICQNVDKTDIFGTVSQKVQDPL